MTQGSVIILFGSMTLNSTGGRTRCRQRDAFEPVSSQDKRPKQSRRLVLSADDDRRVRSSRIELNIEPVVAQRLLVIAQRTTFVQPLVRPVVERRGERRKRSHQAGYCKPYPTLVEHNEGRTLRVNGDMQHRPACPFLIFMTVRVSRGRS